MGSKEATIFGHSLDAWLEWVNVVYLLSVGLVTVLTVAVWKLSALSNS